MSADRNLLFGILSLQLNFVARDQLVEGMHVWVLDKTKCYQQREAYHFQQSGAYQTRLIERSVWTGGAARRYAFLAELEIGRFVAWRAAVALGDWSMN